MAIAARASDELIDDPDRFELELVGVASVGADITRALIRWRQRRQDHAECGRSHSARSLGVELEVDLFAVHLGSHARDLVAAL